MHWRAESRTLEPPALYRWTFNFLVLPDGSRSLGGMVVTRNFFKTLGVKPMLGREFTEAEAARPKVPADRHHPRPRAVAAPVQRRSEHRRHRVRISRYAGAAAVVGVMPPGVRFLPDPGDASEPNYDVNAPVDFWLPFTPDETQPRARGWNAVSRLRDGATLAQAQAEIAALAARQVQADPRLAGLTARAAGGRGAQREARRLLLPLFGLVALVFFVACVNVAGLFVARGLQRHREYAMRCGARRIARAAVPAGDHRERGALDAQRDRRRRVRGRRDHGSSRRSAATPSRAPTR